MSFIKSMLGYLKLKKNLPASIVFYSEGKPYYVNFEDIIDALVECKQKVIYVTSSKDDPVLKKETDLFIPIYIESTFFLVLFFNYLNADIFLTTLPDIDTFHLKRSKDVREMIYVHHSIASMNMIYLPKAFEAYDTIFCVGEYHINECREMEEEYKTKAKNLVKAGYPALDNFIREYNNYLENNLQKNEKKVITIAPSWQKDNIIDLCIEDILDILLKEDFIVKLRPHPRTIQLEKHKLDKIEKKYEKNKNFIIDDKSGSFKSYSETDLMITDWSGTVYKYFYATRRPVVFINTPIKVRNEKYKDYKNIPIEIQWRDKIGKSIDIENIMKVGNIVKNELERKKSEDEINFIDKHIYNISHSGKVCADYIMEKIKK